MVEQESILLAARQHVQGPAYPPQELPPPQQDVKFVLGQEAQRLESFGVAGLVVPQGDPADGLDVPQVSG